MSQKENKPKEELKKSEVKLISFTLILAAVFFIMYLLSGSSSNEHLGFKIILSVVIMGGGAIGLIAFFLYLMHKNIWGDSNKKTKK